MWMTLLSFTPATRLCVQARANKLDAQFAHMRASRRWPMATALAACAVDEVHPLGKIKMLSGESTTPQSGAPKRGARGSRANGRSQQLGHKPCRVCECDEHQHIHSRIIGIVRALSCMHGARSHGRPSASAAFLRPRPAHPAHAATSGVQRRAECSMRRLGYGHPRLDTKTSIASRLKTCRCLSGHGCLHAPRPTSLSV